MIVCQHLALVIVGLQVWFPERRPAVLEASIGAGKAVLFGMRPQYRAQSYLTLKMFLNALAQ